VTEITVTSPTFTVAWHPKRYMLAYGCDDKEKYHDRDRDSGSLKVLAFPEEE
jgi:THO complex subunit 3